MYGEAITKYYASGVGPESKLPFPKDIIRRAIVESLLEEKDREQWNLLSGSYIMLEDFVSDEEYNLVQSFFEAHSPPIRDLTDSEIRQLECISEIFTRIAERAKEKLKDTQALRRKVGLGKNEKPPDDTT